MYSHEVTEYSPQGVKLKTYYSIREAWKETGILRSTISAQVQGNRKTILWYSHIHQNNLVLPNGKVLDVKHENRF